MERESEPPYSIFTPRMKGLIVAIAIVAGGFSLFSSNIYFPAMPTIARDLNVSEELISLTVTSYQIFQGLSPSLWGAVSDSLGRRIAYMSTFAVYIGACVGLALTHRYDVLVILRCLQSTGSASTIAIGGGIIGDITTKAERGGYMGYYQGGVLAPVSIGPVIGGVLSGALGWHSTFWFLTIYSAVFYIFLVILLPETLRSIVGNGSIRPKNPLSVSLLAYYAQKKSKLPPVTAPRTPKKRIDLFAPFKILIKKQCICIMTFLSVQYTVWQITITVMSTLFKSHYNLTETEIGLTFIGNGMGSILGAVLVGKVMDRDYKKYKAMYENEKDIPLEKARLRTVWVWACMLAISTIVFGWTIEYSVHISVPIIMTFFTGATATCIQAIVTTNLIDTFSTQSASAIAALNIARCLCAAGGTAAAIPLCNAMGIGWFFTMLCFLVILSLSLVVIQWRYGTKWRNENREKQETRADAVDDVPCSDKTKGA